MGASRRAPRMSAAARTGSIPNRRLEDVAPEGGAARLAGRRRRFYLRRWIGEKAVKARIYRPAKTATQSGRARTRLWVLEPETESPPTVDSLMGWTGSRDSSSQVRLHFDTVEAAVAYARANGLDYEVSAPRKARPRVGSYADNFRYDRME